MSSNINLDADVFFKICADNPDFAEKHNLVGKNGKLYFVERGAGGSIFGREAEIVSAADIAKKILENPKALKGLNSNQLTQISTQFIELWSRMRKNVGADSVKAVDERMGFVIQKIEHAKPWSTVKAGYAKFKSVLPAASTVKKTCGTVLYTAAVLAAGYFAHRLIG